MVEGLSFRGRLTVALCAVLRQYNAWKKYGALDEVVSAVDLYKVGMMEHVLRDTIFLRTSEYLLKYLDDMPREDGDERWMGAESFLIGMCYICDYVKDADLEHVIFALRSAYDMADQMAIVQIGGGNEEALVQSAPVKEEVSAQWTDLVEVHGSDRLETYAACLDRALCP